MWRAGGSVDKSDVIEPIGAAEQAQVVAQTERYIGRAEVYFEQSFTRIPVLFDLAGTTAGMFRLSGRQGTIRYNPWIFAKYFKENLSSTVPHEVAHYIVHVVYGDRRIKPHGPQWRAVMAHFGADAGVTFDLDLSGIPQRRQRTHPYRCPCRAHELSSTRHNRVQRRKGQYQCRNCSGLLVYAPDLA